MYRLGINMNRRMLYIPVLHIDTNLINSRQKLHAVNQLEKWVVDGVVLLNISSTASCEAKADGNPQRVKKAHQNIFTDTPAADIQDSLYLKVEAALFPNGAQNNNHKNDIRIVSEASRYEAILVTADGSSKSQPGGILGNRYKLEDVVKILSPEEAVDFIKQKIKERDDLNAQYVEEFGGTLPPWTGQD